MSIAVVPFRGAHVSLVVCAVRKVIRRNFAGEQPRC